MSLRALQYFAAHAPDEVPPWFKRKYETKKVVKQTNGGLYEPSDETTYEPYIEYLCRWKFFYAQKMCEAEIACLQEMKEKNNES